MRDVRSILFLDFDDVICPNETCGGFDVIPALSHVERNEAALENFEYLWLELFEGMARGSLAAAPRQAGLDFVDGYVHPTRESVSVGLNSARQRLKDPLSTSTSRQLVDQLSLTELSGPHFLHWPAPAEPVRFSSMQAGDN